MRTTITIDDHLLAEAKRTAARSGKTLRVVVEDALRESLRRRSRGGTGSKSLRIPTYGKGWVRPGIDIKDSASLAEWMDRDDAAR